MNEIAIVGLSAILPENKNVEQFWEDILENKSLISKASEADFRQKPETYFSEERGNVDKSYCLTGAFVRNFKFDAKGYQIDSENLNGLDPIFQWSLQCTREALLNAGYWNKKDELLKCGLVLGNLSFPTKSSRSVLNSLYTDIITNEISGLTSSIDRLKKQNEYNYHNIFSGESLSVLVSKAVGLGGRHFILDAACSSVLYAIKIASDYLNAGKADMMIAGAVSAADPLFINMGFSYYHAFSDNDGVSNPFEKSSGGLSPAEGSGCFVLKRLEDAIQAKDEIIAVIHGTGLSNDGKGKFLLSPNSKGQIESFKRAYEYAGIHKNDISYIECHATGTPVGDATEIASLTSFFTKDKMPFIGAVKSNTGHLLTAAGIPGLIKSIKSIQHKIIPATIGIQNPLDLEDKIITKNQSWEEEKPLLAGVNAFGFGGTNAHIIISDTKQVKTQQKTDISIKQNSKLAITGMDLCFGKISNIKDFADVVHHQTKIEFNLPENRWHGIENKEDILKKYGIDNIPKGNYIEDFDFDFLRYKIPPKEADIICKQQLLILKVADNAIKQSGLKEGQNIGVIIAMQPEIALHKYLGRRDIEWQLNELKNVFSSPTHFSEFKSKAKDFIHPLKSENNSVSAHTGVTGNLMACRISALWDFTGPSFTVACGEDSFMKVIEIAQTMINNKVCDGFVIGAVDIAGEFEHLLLRNKYDEKINYPGEGAAAFVLQPEEKLDINNKAILGYIEEIVVEENPLNDDKKIDGKKLTSLTSKIKHADDILHLELSGNTYHNQYLKNLLTKEFNVTDVEAISEIIGYTYSASGAASLAKSLIKLNQTQETNSRVLIAATGKKASSISIALISGNGDNTFFEKVKNTPILKKSTATIKTGGTPIQHYFGYPDNKDKQQILNKNINTTLMSGKQQEEVIHVNKNLTFTFEEAKDGKMPILKKNYANLIWDEKDLLEFAGGSISKVFGDQYKIIDSYKRKVRLPLPPYLLVSRVTKLDAQIGEFKPSSMTTEYDIPYNAWYSVDGQIPWAVSVESGQCDLMLISYLGIDFENKGERIYRLLDCTLTFLDELPKEGQTLRYDISINSYVKNGDNLLFFFSYNCYVDDKLVLKMTNGCAGFFSDEDLEAGQGLVRSNKELELRSRIPKKHFIPVKNTNKTSYSKEDLIHLINGKPELCFGKSYGHQWRNSSLRLPKEPLLMIDRIINVDLKGGTWGLGLIIAEKELNPNDWYFPCHFKDDEVLAGSLQAEGGGQLLQFYMLFLGLHGLVKDARFQPIEGLSQKVRCRKQVTPKNKKLTYRMEVKEISLIPHPYVISDVEVITEDGVIAVHFENLGLRLKEKNQDNSTSTNTILRKEAFINEEQLSNYALGSLVKAFGKDFDVFEKRILSRQPNTDLQLVSRIVSFSGERHKFSGNPFVISEYDVPLNPWYYQENSSPTIPYSILMEIALQPCGVLTAHLGSTFIYPDKDVFFRNLDGEGTLFKHMDLRGKTITNKAVLTSNTAYEGNIIQKFNYEMSCDGLVFYKGTAAFGFFPKDSLVNQIGLDRGDIIPAWHENLPSYLTKETINLNSIEGEKLFQPKLGSNYYKLSKPQLNFLDEIIYVKNGGKFEKGYVYGVKEIDASDWFYNCHFYQDPVMPGSLGVEAMLQAMQSFCIMENIGNKFKKAGFSHPDNHQTKWKYRGQIIPDNKFMRLEIHITNIIEENNQVLIIGDGSLWKENIRIYELTNLAVLVKEMN